MLQISLPERFWLELRTHHIFDRCVIARLPKAFFEESPVPFFLQRGSKRIFSLPTPSITKFSGFTSNASLSLCPRGSSPFPKPELNCPRFEFVGPREITRSKVSCYRKSKFSMCQLNTYVFFHLNV